MAVMSRIRTLALSGVVLIAANAAAQQPRITNGTIARRTASSPFVTSFQSIVAAQAGVAWIGYAVPAAEGHSACCNGSNGWEDGRGCCSACRLEPSAAAGPATQPVAAGGPIRLEGSSRLSVLFRVVDRQVERIRVFSEACELDAGGRPVEWLENVSPADSLSLLETLVATDANADGRSRTRNGALAAIALHGGPARDLAADTLLRLARTAPSARTRGDALFWLAQVASAKAGTAIADRVEADPDTEVKKRAVFALSQLPKDEGVPLLIQVARVNRNPAVRRQAMFWLGQSRDPRAVDFFEQILK